MEHLIVKTGLGAAIFHVIEELGLQEDKNSIKDMLIDIFQRKFDDFKKRHNPKFTSSNLIAYYVVQNQYPVGENDIHQYFRCLAFDAKIGAASLNLGTKEDKKPYTIIEGYSRNQICKKRKNTKLQRDSRSESYNESRSSLKPIYRRRIQYPIDHDSH